MKIYAIAICVMALLCLMPGAGADFEGRDLGSATGQTIGSNETFKISFLATGSGKLHLSDSWDGDGWRALQEGNQDYGTGFEKHTDMGNSDISVSEPNLYTLIWGNDGNTTMKLDYHASWEQDAGSDYAGLYIVAAFLGMGMGALICVIVRKAVNRRK